MQENYKKIYYKLSTYILLCGCLNIHAAEIAHSDRLPFDLPTFNILDSLNSTEEILSNIKFYESSEDLQFLSRYLKAKYYRKSKQRLVSAKKEINICLHLMEESLSSESQYQIEKKEKETIIARIHHLAYLIYSELFNFEKAFYHIKKSSNFDASIPSQSTIERLSECNKSYGKIKGKENDIKTFFENFFSENANTIPSSIDFIEETLKTEILPKCPSFTEFLTWEIGIYIIKGSEEKSFQKGDGIKRKEEREKAKALAVSLIKRNPEDDKALFLRGILFLEDGKIKEANHLFIETRKIDNSENLYKLFYNKTKSLKKSLDEANLHKGKGNFNKEAKVLENIEKDLVIRSSLKKIVLSRKCIAYKNSADGEINILEKALEACNESLKIEKGKESIEAKIEILSAMENYTAAKNTCKRAIHYFKKLSKIQKWNSDFAYLQSEENVKFFEKKYKEIEKEEKETEGNLYKIMGVKENATPREIKKRYKYLSRKYHPDKAPENLTEEYSEKLSKINNAYEILTDPERKRKYDYERKHEQQGFGGGGGGGRGFSFSDFFDDDFGGFGGFGGRRRSSGRTFHFSFG